MTSDLYHFRLSTHVETFGFHLEYFIEKIRRKIIGRGWNLKKKKKKKIHGHNLEFQMDKNVVIFFFHKILEKWSLKSLTSEVFNFLLEFCIVATVSLPIVQRDRYHALYLSLFLNGYNPFRWRLAEWGFQNMPAIYCFS